MRSADAVSASPGTRRGWLRWLVVAGVLAGCVAGMSWYLTGAVTAAHYTAQNEALAAAMPPYPGALPAGITTSPYPAADGETAAPAGYVTSVAYTIPAGLRVADVLNFYRSRLEPGWYCTEEEVSVVAAGSSEPLGSLQRLVCDRGPARVIIDPLEMWAPQGQPIEAPRYAVTVDFLANR